MTVTSNDKWSSESNHRVMFFYIHVYVYLLVVTILYFIRSVDPPNNLFDNNFPASIATGVSSCLP